MTFDIETISAAVHEQWMENKRKAGVSSRKLESGEELMVPYAQLSEQAKELDRSSVRSVVSCIRTVRSVVPRNRFRNFLASVRDAMERFSS